jgi:hypothetical protein
MDGERIYPEVSAMPLRDHFHAPLRDDCPWRSFGIAWVNTVVAHLNHAILPENYRATPHLHLGATVEADVATLRGEPAPAANGNGVATAVWAPPQARLAAVVDFADLDSLEIRITDRADRRLVAAIELVSPANKDRPAHRAAFVAKGSAYLQHRIALVVLDVVTERRENLHRLLVEALAMPDEWAEVLDDSLYAASYRLWRRDDDRDQQELWPEPLMLGASLPTVPLWISPEQAVPLDLETCYAATFAALRLEM